MAAIPEAMEHIGESAGIRDHDHDLVHELSKRLDALWRYDQRIANAEGREELQQFWRDLKKHEQKTVDKLKELIATEIKNDCF